MQRLHPVLIKAVLEGIIAIFQDNQYADKVIQRLLKSNPKWGARDRAFIAETVYDLVRWWRLIWYLSGNESTLTYPNLWKLIGTYWVWKGNQLPDWKEFKGVNSKNISNRLEKVKQNRAVLHSIPDWIDDRGLAELGTEKWESELNALNTEAEVFVRTNTLKVEKEQLLNEFVKADVAATLIENTDAIHIKKRQNLFQFPFFKQGFFEMQDIGSQHIAPYLQVEPGMRVIDACAGAGGKSLHLAALMKNKGRIISMDVEQWKLNELKRRAKRAGSFIIETKLIEGNKTIKRLKGTADRLLLDVPCSGLGVLKRNPDAKWKLQSDFIDNLITTQQEIITSYSSMLKPGGYMVYATCSILPSENEHQVTRFLETHSNFELLKENKLWPSEKSNDGFYMALLKKKP